MINIPIKKRKLSDWIKMQTNYVLPIKKKNTLNIKTQVKVKSIEKRY